MSDELTLWTFPKPDDGPVAMCIGDQAFRCEAFEISEVPAEFDLNARVPDFSREVTVTFKVRVPWTMEVVPNYERVSDAAS